MLSVLLHMGLVMSEQRNDFSTVVIIGVDFRGDKGDPSPSKLRINAFI